MATHRGPATRHTRVVQACCVAGTGLAIAGAVFVATTQRQLDRAIRSALIEFRLPPYSGLI